jgi:Tol biopolymer transport system component
MALPKRFSRISRVGLIGTAGLLLTGLVALGSAVVYNELSGAGGSSSDSAADVLRGGPPTASPDLVPTPSPDHTPAPPVSLGSVAYVKDGNLWVLNLDSGDDRMVVQREVALTYGTTAQNLMAFNPEWSVDGQWIAFNIISGTQPSAFRSPYLVRASDGLLELGGSNSGRDWSPTELVLYGDGALVRPIGSFPADYAHQASDHFVTNVGYGEPKWSPDGRRIAVSEALVTYTGITKRVSPPYRVSIIDPETVQPTIAPNDTPHGVTRIFETDSGAGPPIIHSWSPDGKYILFWIGPGDAHMGDVALIPVDNPSGIRIIGQAREVPTAAAWSPDGSLLAFVDSGSKFIQVMTPSGEVRSTFGLADNAASEPSWSPDGNRLAYVQGGRIWTGLSDGSSDAAQITIDTSYSDRYPQWSGDGKRILFVRLNADAVARQVAGPAELWLMNSDGSDPRKVADMPSIDLATQSFDGYDIDWTQYLSWYLPTGIGPLEAAPGPSPQPTFGISTPVPGIYNTPTFRID